MATHSSILAMNRGVQQATVHGVTKSWTQLSECTHTRVQNKVSGQHRLPALFFMVFLLHQWANITALLPKLLSLDPHFSIKTKKSTNNECWRRCGEKGTLLHCWWECKLVQPLWRTVWRFLKKLEIELPYDPAILLLGIHTEETRSEIDTCTPMFIATLFRIARTWKQPRCPSTDKWIRKLWYIYTMEYYSALKRIHLNQL